MSETLHVDQQIEATLHTFNHLYRRFLDESDLRLHEEDDDSFPFVMGSKSSLMICSDNFANRVLPDAKRALVDNYASVAGGFKESKKSIELLMFTDMRAQELAVYYQLSQSRAGSVDDFQSQFGSIKQLITKFGINDATLREVNDYRHRHSILFPRVVLTRLLPAHARLRHDPVTQKYLYNRMAFENMYTVVKELVSDSVSPLTPEELQENYFDPYVLRRMKQNDKLIPPIYITALSGLEREE